MAPKPPPKRPRKGRGAPTPSSSAAIKKAATPPKEPDLPGHGARQPNPRKEVSRATLMGLARIQCTHEEMAAVLGMSLKTLQDRFAEDPTLLEVIEEGKATGKASLRRMQFKAAEAGNIAALIWLGKQTLGQKEPSAPLRAAGSVTVPGIPGTVGGKPGSGEGAVQEVRFTFAIGEGLPEEDEGVGSSDGIQRAAGPAPAGKLAG